MPCDQTKASEDCLLEPLLCCAALLGVIVLGLHVDPPLLVHCSAAFVVRCALIANCHPWLEMCQYVSGVILWWHQSMQPHPLNHIHGHTYTSTQRHTQPYLRIHTTTVHSDICTSTYLRNHHQPHLHIYATTIHSPRSSQSELEPRASPVGR